MVLHVFYVFRKLKTPPFMVLVFVISCYFSDWLEVHCFCGIFDFLKLLVFMTLLKPGSFFSCEVFPVQEFGIFICYFVKALSGIHFVVLSLGEVWFELEAKSLILFKAVLLLDLFLEGKTEELMKVDFTGDMKVSIGDVLFGEMNGDEWIGRLEFRFNFGFELEDSLGLRSREIRFLNLIHGKSQKTCIKFIIFTSQNYS